MEIKKIPVEPVPQRPKPLLQITLTEEEQRKFYEWYRSPGTPYGATPDKIYNAISENLA